MREEKIVTALTQVLLEKVYLHPVKLTFEYEPIAVEEIDFLCESLKQYVDNEKVLRLRDNGYFEKLTTSWWNAPLDFGDGKRHSQIRIESDAIISRSSKLSGCFADIKLAEAEMVYLLRAETISWGEFVAAVLRVKGDKHDREIELLERIDLNPAVDWGAGEEKPDIYVIWHYE